MPLHVSTESGRLYFGDLMPPAASSRSPRAGLTRLISRSAVANSVRIAWDGPMYEDAPEVAVRPFGFDDIIQKAR